MNLRVLSYCQINNEEVTFNGQPYFKNEHDDDFNAYFKSLYKYLALGYSKFYKMDNLSKLGFLASEVLLSEHDTAQWNGENVGIVVANRHSSLDTDQKHVESITNADNYFPSPAIFVYTLPNIMLGEICIRHKIQGENSCFLMKDFDAEFFNQYVHDLFENENYQYCITGWIDFHPTKYSAQLLLIAKSSNKGTATEVKEHLKRIIP